MGECAGGAYPGRDRLTTVHLIDQGFYVFSVVDAVIKLLHLLGALPASPDVRSITGLSFDTFLRHLALLNKDAIPQLSEILRAKLRARYRAGRGLTDGSEWTELVVPESIAELRG